MPCDAILPCISARMPSDASAMPAQPCSFMAWPLVMIDRSTVKIFRVVVTVVQTSGSKFAMVKKMNDWPAAEQSQQKRIAATGYEALLQQQAASTASELTDKFRSDAFKGETKFATLTDAERDMAALECIVNLGINAFFGHEPRADLFPGHGTSEGGNVLGRCRGCCAPSGPRRWRAPRGMLPQCDPP